MTLTATVPCGMHTMGEPRTERGWLTSYACGGTCYINPANVTVSGSDMVTGISAEPDEIVYYICDRCGHRTARYGDGRPLPAWDGILRDGSDYFEAAPDENDHRL